MTSLDDAIRDTNVAQGLRPRSELTGTRADARGRLVLRMSESEAANLGEVDAERAPTTTTR
jgi:hypothetical protein